MAAPHRLVVCCLGGDRGPLELPRSEVDEDRPFISGGERSLYELAAAAASLGIDVELRGTLNGPILEQVTSAAGASVRVGLDPRRPAPGELVVVPEGIGVDILGALHLSPARAVVALLAPPGLWGWSFLSAADEVHDPHAVPFEAVGRPESFRAIEALGFAMWTNARGIADAGRRAGVAVEWVGTGTPVPFPDPPAKTVDVAVVEHNRWARRATEVAARLPEASVLRVGPLPSTYSLCDALGPARLLLWPSRIEGMSRIAREARAVGTVPVALDTSPFVTAEDHGAGVVLVPDLDAIAEAAGSLLKDPERLERLGREAAEGARSQADWGSYVERVHAAIDRSADDPTAPARGRFGDEIDVWDTRRREMEQRVGTREAELDAVRGELDAARGERDAAAAERDRLGAELTRSEDGRQSALAELAAVSAVLARVGSERDQARAALEEASAELEAQRQRLVVRLVDRSPLARVWRAVRRPGSRR